MADDKRGRDKQARDAERRQRERELQEARDRADEAEPDKQLSDLEDMLEIHDYPTTTADVTEASGDLKVETQDGRKSIEEVLAPIDNETYDSADDVRNRIQRLIDRR